MFARYRFIFVVLLALTTVPVINTKDVNSQRHKKTRYTPSRFSNQFKTHPQASEKDTDDSTLYFSQLSKKFNLQKDAQYKIEDLKNSAENHVQKARTSGMASDEESWMMGVNMTCELCKMALEAITGMLAERKDVNEVEKFAASFCKTFHIESDRVCDYVIPQYTEMVLEVMTGTVLSDDQICGLTLGVCPVTDLPGQWNITMSDKPKPPVTPHVLPKKGSPTLRVLHLTDIHMDVVYQPGADAECGEPLCCRAYDQYPAPSESRRAGQWGDYRHCDLPYYTLEQLFAHLRNLSDQFDYVMFTGDLAAHDVWNQTRTQQLDKLFRLSSLFRRYLPDKPVYTCLGNHEGVPCNSFPPDTVQGQSMDWQYAAYRQAWGYWLPESTAHTIMRGGFYSFSPFPGLRIVSLNANYGDPLNWWLLVNDTDPQGQLQWLADTLQQAEDAGEKVHILSHQQPSCLMKNYALNYYRLINRYESTVVAQFGGHSHQDYYEVFYDLRNASRAVHVAYVAGSLTPYSFGNPAFRVYTIDGDYPGSSWEVLDYSHFYLDLQTANTGARIPVWKHEYSAKEAYQMSSLFPQDWSDLVYRMKANDTLFQQFYRYYHKSAPSAPCDASCKRQQLCALKTAGSRDPHLCDDI